MSDRTYYESYRNNEMHKVRANWKDYILLSNAEPEIDYTFGGINSFPVYLYNRSIYRADIVEVTVYYIKRNGDLFKTEKLSFHNLEGGKQLALYAPSSGKIIREQILLHNEIIYLFAIFDYFTISSTNQGCTKAFVL